MNRNTLPDAAALAAERKPLSTSGDTEHKMLQVGDELTGVVIEAATVDTKYGERSFVKVAPMLAISDAEDVTALGEAKLWCSGFELSMWFIAEAPEPGDLVSIRLDELRDTGKASPLKHFSATLRRDEGASVDDDDPGLAVDTSADAKPDDDIPF
jgi:hypothetical protein